MRFIEVRCIIRNFISITERFTNQWRIQDFPEEGRQHEIFPKFPQNCMKSKEFGPPGGGGGRPKFYYVDPPLLMLSYSGGVRVYPEGKTLSSGL